MGHKASQSHLDAFLDFVSANATKITITAGEPASYTDANNLPSDGTPGLKLAEVAVDGSDFTKAVGDVSGRKTTVGAQTEVPLLAPGNGDHVNILSGTEVLRSHPFTQKTFAITDTVDIAAFFFDILDPAAA